MQSDEEIGKVAAAVPVIISRALELFVETLLKNANSVISDRGARTLTQSHMYVYAYERSFFFFNHLKNIINSKGIPRTFD